MTQLGVDEVTVPGPAKLTGALRPLADEPFGLVLAAVPAGSEVQLETCSDDGGVEHRSWAVYRAGPGGNVDPARQAPERGSYAGVDPFGLWWSQRARHADGYSRGLTPVATVVTARARGSEIARTRVERLRVADDVSIACVRVDGLAATACLPRAGWAAGVVVLGGSEGGLDAAQELAGSLASRGFGALALAYFGASPAPPSLAEVPLESVGCAAAWLAEEAGGDDLPVGLLGVSRGAELALQFAARRTGIRAVVGFSASGVGWPGFDPKSGFPRPAWTYGGKSLPYAIPRADRFASTLARSPLRLHDLFADALADERRVARAVIPVERIDCPVLLVSGGADEMWPSTTLAERVLRRRAVTRWAVHDRHLAYPEAGHGVGRVPGLPARPTTFAHPIDGRRYALGGTPAANAHATAAAWPAVLAFLRSHLLAPSDGPCA